MTQQEIFQNMTKGEWKFYPHGRILFTIEPEEKTIADSCTNKFDGEAIKIAVNNTYGNGINPERINDLVLALEEILTLEKKDFIKAYKIATEALTSAKIITR